MNQIRLLSDVQLLEALCSEQDDSALYEEFVKRFLEEVKEECLKICKQRKLDSHIGRQIAHEVFEKLRKYKSFKADQIKSPTSHQGILVYLLRISRNLFNDWHRKEKRAQEPYVGKNYFEDITESLQPPDGIDQLKWKRDVSLAIFKKLNSKEQTIILADIEHKRSAHYLPDDVTETLSTTLGVEKATIRKIRERAISKIKKAIYEINQ